MASSQSTTTRLLIIASIYAVVLIAYPFARHLTSVKRLPIDAAAIEQWRRQLVDTGCAATVPTTVRIGGDWTQADDIWKQDVAAHVEDLLQRSSEAGSSSRSVESSWCVQWQVDLTGSQQQTGFNAFDYTSSNSTAPQQGQILLSIPPNLPSHSAKSVALSLARRLAIDLDLPFKDRLVDTEPAATGTTEEEREPQVEQHVAEIPTGVPMDDIVTSSQQARSLLPELIDDDESKLLQQLQAPSRKQSSDGQDLSISLPSHVMLHFHVLNKELSLQGALAPLPASFSDQLRTELQQTQKELAGITELGMSSSWAIGKETIGVQWDSIEWLGERRWEEEEEVEEEREVEYEEEIPIEEEEEQETDDDEDESKPSSPRTQMVTRTRIERYTTIRMVPRNESIPKRVSHLSTDQLEIFVDENGWDLTDHGSTGDQLAGYPYLYPSEQQSPARNAVEVKNLHFLLYNPAKDHRPLVHLGEAEDEAERRKLAVEQEAERAAWGWIVPSWGGAIIYNGFKEAGGDQQLPTEQELQQEILPLFHEQIRTLLALPPLSDKDKEHRHGLYHLKWRLVLSRAREAVETLTATLNSLTKLTNLEVGREVQASVSTSLAALAELAAFASDKMSTVEEMFPVSLLASTSASAAFHDPRMVGMLYFPAEHTYAVYTPLFGPLAVPMILAGLKIGKSWLKGRKRRSTKRIAAKED